MKKDYTELILGVESMIRALVVARGEIREYLGNFEDAALSLENIIESNFMKEIASGEEPEIRGLYDYLHGIFSKLSGGDPDIYGFCCDIKRELSYTFGLMICVLSKYLSYLKDDSHKPDVAIYDNPFYEVTEIIDNAKE